MSNFMRLLSVVLAFVIVVTWEIHMGLLDLLLHSRGFDVLLLLGIFIWRQEVKHPERTKENWRRYR